MPLIWFVEHYLRQSVSVSWEVDVLGQKDVEMDFNSHSINARVGSLIKVRRKELGMSAKKLGEEIGCAGIQIQKYESGRNEIHVTFLWRCSQALGVPVGYFFGTVTSDQTDNVVKLSRAKTN